NPDITDMNRIFPGRELLLPVIDADGKLPSFQYSGVDDSSADVKVEQPDEMVSYTIRPGDSITAVIHRLYGVGYREALSFLDEVATANPHIKDINMIHPGQRLLLPSGFKSPLGEIRREKQPPIVESSDFSFSSSQNYSILGEMLALFDGEIITEGSYHVPLKQLGMLTLDCLRVPMAEIADGNRILIDEEGLIPDSIGSALRQQWNNYYVVSGPRKGNPEDLLDEVVSGLGPPYKYEREGKRFTIGNNPEVTIFFDSIVYAGRAASGIGFDTIGIRLLQNAEEAIPQPLKNAINQRGVAVMELLEVGSPFSAGTSFESSSPTSVRGKRGTDLAQDILLELNFLPERDVDINVYTMERDGFNLTIRAELFLDIHGRRHVITSERAIIQFVDVLEKHGISVMTLSKDDMGVEVIKKVLSLLRINFEKDTFSFQIFSGEKYGQGKISFSALGVEMLDGTVYFVEGEFDEYIYRVLRERWKVKVVVY
ncbi:MAG: hypothetical protein PHU03_08005, partial [Syntrophales bacterium]|nr:hypothetical protein [Syntrophales bacterium]